MHIDRSFDNELRILSDRMLAMGGFVEQQLGDALRAWMERDPVLARRVIESDRKVNSTELEIDALCLKLLALRQPAASDLRFVTSALKIVVDLERMGDLAVTMAERAVALIGQPPIEAAIDLPRMALAAQRMLRDALDALVARDAKKAEAVLAADDQIDAWLSDVFVRLTREMEQQPGRVASALSTLSFAKAIERLADHATNVAEMVVFVSSGDTVRHRSLKDEPAGRR